MNPDRNNRAPSRSWLFGLLLIAGVVCAYQPAWHAGFIWDDTDYVTENPLLTAPDGLWRIWFSTDSPSQYFPAVYTTFRMEHALWGLNSTGYHWVNILLHAINAVLLWRLLRRLAVPAAWLGAAIFALHPVQVESVAWITELKNVQSTFFFLLALLAWTRFVGARTPSSAVAPAAAGPQTPDARRPTPPWAWYALALVFHAFALFSKTTACTLPAALLLVLWLQRRPLNRARWLQVIPFFALSIAMGLVSIWWERHHQGTEGAFYTLSWLDRFLVASRALWFYLGKLCWPANLTFSYPYWRIDAGNPLAYVWLLACAALAAAVYFGRRRFGRGVEVGAVFFAAMLAPMLGFFMMYTFKYTFVADHYQYLAMVGPAALAAAALSVGVDRFLPSRRGLTLVAGGVLMAVLGGLSWQQSRMYRDLETLWRTTIARNPDSYMGHNNLGAILLGRNEVDAATAHFQRALEILPNNANAHGNVAHALLKKGQAAEALVHFRQAAEIDPRAPKSHSDLAYGLLQTGAIDEAVVEARAAVAIYPDAAEARNVLGLALLAAGQTDAAATEFARALELRPDYLEAAKNVSNALMRSGRAGDAIAYLERCVALRPDDVEAHYGLAAACFQAGRIDDAIAHFQIVVEREPQNAEAQNNLGWTLFQRGRTEEAIARFRGVLRLQPEFAMAHCNLALAYLRQRQPREAVAEFQAFLQRQPDAPPVLAELAWLLATSPDATIRDGARAMELAQRADELTHGEDARVLRTLAAACAEAGKFPAAVTAAKRAVALAEAQPDAGFTAELRGQLAAYEAGTPYREADTSNH